MSHVQKIEKFVRGNERFMRLYHYVPNRTMLYSNGVTKSEANIVGTKVNE